MISLVLAKLFQLLEVGGSCVETCSRTDEQLLEPDAAVIVSVVAVVVAVVVVVVVELPTLNFL